MMSISWLRGGQEHYYSELTKRDELYWTKRDETLGEWMGEGASALGLSGKVEGKELSHVLQGFSPDGRRLLVQRQDGKPHQRGWDLTVSVPKSVSILWASSGDERRAMVDGAIKGAVKKMVAYLEREAAVTRRGKGGARIEPGKLVIAAFLHRTSRARDPQLHCHLVTANVCVREDGTTGTLRSKDLYLHKMVAGTLFRAELGSRLRALGIALEADRIGFRVRGVPKPLDEALSNRRKEIKKALEESGGRGARAAEKAALRTRERKKSVALETLVSKWREVGVRFGFTEQVAVSLFGRPKLLSERRKEKLLAAAVKEVLPELSSEKSAFRERDLARKVATRVQRCGVGAAAILNYVHEAVNGRQIVCLSEKGRDALYATRELLKVETGLLEAAGRLAADQRHAVSERKLKRTLSRKRFATMSQEQRAALAHVTGASGLALVEGRPGSGKTFLLQAVRESYERAGYKVVGCSLAGKAARELESASGIRSATIARTLMRLKPDPKWLFKHTVRQIMRAALKKPTYRPERLKLNRKTVLVIDEAAIVPTKTLAKLLAFAEKAQAKAVLVGDRQQLQAIDEGGGFGGLRKRFGGVELTEVRRQRAPWQREATMLFAQGDVREALQSYAQRGHVHVGSTKEHAMRALLRTWLKAPERVEDKLILAGTRAEVSELNSAAQAARLSRDELRGRGVRVGDGTVFRRDRVLFTKNDELLGISNGDLGTVERITRDLPWKRQLVVRLDRIEKRRLRNVPVRVLIPLKEAREIMQLGYCTSTHRAQGATIEGRTFALMGGANFHREMAFVELTRHRKACEIFVSRKDAGRDLEQLVEAASRSRRKVLAHHAAVEMA